MPYDAPSPALLDLPELQLTGDLPPLNYAPQHVGREHLVATALADVGQRAPHLARLARVVLPRMPRRLLASSTLHTADARSGFLLLDDAVRAKHFALRSETHIHAVGADCDHADWPDLLETLVGHGMPRPTWITVDPWTGRAHLIWWLADPIPITEKAKARPIEVAGACMRVLAMALRGDTAYTGLLTKNPWAPGRPSTRYGSPEVPAIWEQHRATTPDLLYAVIAPDPRLHHLGTLRAALARWQQAEGLATPRARPRPTADAAPRGEKGTRLFHTARYRVYAVWPCSPDVAVAVVAQTAAELGSPAKPRAVERMGRRMHVWCTNEFGDAVPRRFIRRGRDRLECASLDLHERQAIAGRRSGAQNASDTDARISAAVATLQAAGTPLTQVAIARQAGVSERTVRSRWTRSDAPNPASQNRQIGVNPVERPQGAPGAPQGTPLPRINESNSSLADLAADDRRRKREAAARERERARLLAALASAEATARRRGAEPPRLPAVPARLRADPEIQAAVRSAEAAAADARRRHAARVARENAASRRADMVDRLRRDPGEAWSWWRRQMADHDSRWDLVVHSADPADLPDLTLRRQREAAAVWSMWRAATREARRDLDPRQPDRIDLAIPW